MSAQRDPETILAAWLDEGPTELPSATRRAIVTAVTAARQDRQSALKRPRLQAGPFRGLGFIAAAILVAVALLVVMGGGLGGPGPLPPPRETPRPSATHTAPSSRPTPSPYSVATLFTSPLYRYSVIVPAGWLAIPATSPWDGASGLANDSPVVDQLLPPEQQNRCQAVFLCAPQLFAVATAYAGSLDAWVKERNAAAADQHPCPGSPESTDSIVMDGAPAVIERMHCPEADGPLLLDAYVVRNGYGYDFVLQDSAREATVETLDRQEFTTFVSNVSLP